MWRSQRRACMCEYVCGCVGAELCLKGMTEWELNE